MKIDSYILILTFSVYLDFVELSSQDGLPPRVPQRQKLPIRRRTQPPSSQSSAGQASSSQPGEQALQDLSLHVDSTHRRRSPSPNRNQPSSSQPSSSQPSSSQPFSNQPSSSQPSLIQPYSNQPSSSQPSSSKPSSSQRSRPADHFASGSASSQPEQPIKTTLKDLFPLSNGIHFPDIEELGRESAQSIPNFTTLNGHSMVVQAETFLKRGHVIFGYEHTETGYIMDLGLLFNQRLLAVFNKINKQWYILEFHELTRLGMGRNLKLVRAHDVAHFHVHSPYIYLNPQDQPDAHQEACEEAYHAAKFEEWNQKKLYDQGSKSLEDGAEAVREAYYETHYKAYQMLSRKPSRGR